MRLPVLDIDIEIDFDTIIPMNKKVSEYDVDFLVRRSFRSVSALNKNGEASGWSPKHSRHG